MKNNIILRALIQITYLIIPLTVSFGQAALIVLILGDKVAKENFPLIKSPEEMAKNKK
jgi:hypothetical protein